jgi:glycosyltransferase involved in cell wall biosynthesis
MSEVADEAAILIDPANPVAAAKAIAAGIKNRERLRAAGFRNLERFDEKVILDQYCAFYEAIVAGEPATRP